MNRKDLLSMADLTSADIDDLLRTAIKLKQGIKVASLSGQSLALLFEKPSLRTRVSFEVGMYQLGGNALYLSPAEVGVGSREPAADVARVLSRFVNGIVARTFAHSTVTDLAAAASIPVINGLSDEEHPCQILADLLTIYEKKGKLRGIRLCYIGDGNNVANSLALGAALSGVDFAIASPAGYKMRDDIWNKAAEFARVSGSKLEDSDDPRAAASNADAIYTDVWTSMGQEKEAAVRKAAFAGYQITPAILKLGKPDVIFMHPLPAHHGQEVSAGLLEEPASVVFDQAENRLHAQKAVLIRLMSRGPRKR